MSELPPLPIETVLSVDELESGRVLVRPLAGLGLAAYGEEDDCKTELELFLAEHLRQAGAPAQAAFSMPGAVEARSVEVELVRPDLPERLAKPLRVRMPCAVIGDGRARWVVVLPLALTVYVDHDEDLDEVVAAEARRHVGVVDPGPRGTLALLPPRAHRLERATVTLERRGLPEVLATKKRADEAHKKKHALSVLRSVARRVFASELKGPPSVGLERPLATLGALLSGKRRMSVVLVGEERAGKSTLVHEWVRSFGDDRLAPLVFATSGAQLVAGMSLLGQWQERVKRVMEAAENLDAVLWLDDLRDLLGDARGHVDLAAAITPWLDEGRVRVIGELSPEAADLFATRQPGLMSALQPLRLEPQDARAARAALRACIDHSRTNEPHRARVHEGAIDAIVELTDRYQPYRPFPGKAVRLYDELRSSAERAHHGQARELGAAEVYELFGVQSGIPLFLLRDDVAWRTDHARAFLERRLVGQREAVERVAGTLAVVKAGLAPGDRPLASFLFAGPTGVGKTALARALAELLFGSPDRLVRFDMSEMADPFAAERLIRGTSSDEGLLTARVRQQPFCVVLLDEIEKAHPSVFDLLLQVLGEGRLTDARGRTAYFHDAIVVMTSNLGSQHRARKIGIDPPAEDAAERYVEAVEAHFRPELVNRIDRVIPFSSLDRPQIRAVAERIVQGVTLRTGLAELGVALEVTAGALDLLAERGYEEAYGARAMRRRLEDELVAPLARLLAPLGASTRNARAVARLDLEPAPDGHRLAARTSGDLVIEVLRGADRSAREELGVVDEVAERRRWARAQLDLPTVEDCSERAAYLLAELSYGKPERIEARARQTMLSEHHRLKEALAAVESAIGELETIEELALGAVLAGDDASPLREEARAADVAFRSALLGLLLDADPRSEITVLAQEWDRQRPLDRWLGGLIEVLGDLGWQLIAHVHRDPAPAPADWPKERPYGPPRTAAQIAERLARTERDPMTVILRVRGPHAGTLLALEAGVHRHHTGPSGEPSPAFVVRSLAQRWTLEDRDWASNRVLPGPIPFGAHGRLTPAVREVHRDHVEVDERRARVDVPAARYWPELRAIALTHLVLLEAREGARAALLESPLDRPAEAPQ